MFRARKGVLRLSARSLQGERHDFMKASRITQTNQKGHFVTLTLSCGHSVKERLGYWQPYPDDRRKTVECPQCKGYRR